MAVVTDPPELLDEELESEEEASEEQEAGRAKIGAVKRASTAVKQRADISKGRTKTIKSPARAVDRNYLHGGDYRTWVYWEVEMLPHFDHLRVLLKDNELERLKGVLQQLPGYMLHVIRDVEDYPVDEAQRDWEDQIAIDASEKLRANHVEHRREQGEQLARDGYKRTRLYVGIALKSSESIGSSLATEIEKMLGVDPITAQGDSEKIYGAEVRRLQNIFVDKHLQTRSLSQDELCQLIRRMSHPGQPNLPRMEFKQDQPVRGKSAMARLARWSGYDRDDYIKIVHAGVSSYASVLAYSALPEDFSEVEWLFQTDENDNPVPCSMRITVVKSQKALREARRDQQALFTQRDELLKNAGANKENLQEVFDKLALVEEVITHCKKKGVGHKLLVDAMLMVSGTSLQQVRRTTEHLVNVNSEDGIEFDVDNVNQVDMLQSMLPGSGVVYDLHRQKLDAAAVAAGMMRASSRFGNGGTHLGVVLGRERQPLLYSHHRAIKANTDTNVVQVIVGPLGTGKTFIMLQMGAGDAKDGFIVIMDEGKGDTKLVGEIPGVPTSDLDLTKWPGILNPGTVALPDERHQMILAFLKRNSDGYLDEWGGSLDDAVREELVLALAEAQEAQEALADSDKTAPVKPNLYRLLYKLVGEDPVTHKFVREESYKQTDEYKLGRSLRAFAEQGHGKLFFSNEYAPQDIAGLFEAGTMTFVRYGDLQVPDKLKDEIKKHEPAERHALEARYLANYLYTGVAMDRSRPVSIFKDEFSIDIRLGGMEFVEKLARIGRAFQTILTVGSQVIDDFSEKFLKTAATVIILRMEDPDAALQAAKAVGLDLDTPESQAFYKQEFHGLSPIDMQERRGEAFMKILGGSVALVQFQNTQRVPFLSNYEARQLMLNRVMQLAREQLEAEGGSPRVYRATSYEEALVGLARLNVKLEDITESSEQARETIKRIIRRMQTLRKGEYITIVGEQLIIGQPMDFGQDGELSTLDERDPVLA